MKPYRCPPIDHGLLSPSGKCSKRNRDALMRDWERRCAESRAAYEAENAVEIAAVEAKAQRQRQRDRIKQQRDHAAFLRHLAAGGMKPRVYAREAARIEAECLALEAELDKTES